MAHIKLGQLYDHVTVLNVKENIQIKKAQGESKYQGTQINYEDKDGDVHAAKMAQSWLDVSYQEDLKAAISALKPGDEITLYKEKGMDEDAYNAIMQGDDEEKKKKAGFWGVKKIYQGFVVPDEMEKKAGAAPSAASAPKDLTGMHVGHAIKGAAVLRRRHKKDLVESSKEVIEVTDKLAKELIASGKNAYEAGNTAGMAVLCACELVTKAGSLEDTARKLVEAIVPKVVEMVKEFHSPKADPEPEKPVEQEEPEEEEEEEGGIGEETKDDFDDTVPF